MSIAFAVFLCAVGDLGLSEQCVAWSGWSWMTFFGYAVAPGGCTGLQQELLLWDNRDLVLWWTPNVCATSFWWSSACSCPMTWHITGPITVTMIILNHFQTKHELWKPWRNWWALCTSYWAVLSKLTDKCIALSNGAVFEVWVLALFNRDPHPIHDTGIHPTETVQ